jgi:YegS/Rv2252/BmrU family lipid kinase
MHSFNNNKTLFILNPRAGNNRLSVLIKRFDNYRNEFDYTTISKIEDFRSFIKSHINKYEIFIAVGGDGTVNSLASVLIGTGKILGVLPIGSGNGFAREMGFTNNIRTLLKDIKKGGSFLVDVLTINDVPCINVAGVGIDSFVAHEFHGLNKRGAFNYGIAILKTMKRIKPFTASINYGSTLIEDRFYMISVANTRQFGNNAFLAPGANPCDGKYNLVLLKPFPMVLLPVFVIKLLNGSLKESKYIKYLDSDKQLVIRTAEKKYHIDGEPVVFDNGIKINIRKNVLAVLKSSHKRTK